MQRDRDSELWSACPIEYCMNEFLSFVRYLTLFVAAAIALEISNHYWQKALPTVIRFWRWLFPVGNPVSARFRLQNILRPTLGWTILLLVSVAFTVGASVFVEELSTSKAGLVLVKANKLSIEESLNLAVAIPWSIGAMSPFVIAAALAMGSPLPMHKDIVAGMYLPLADVRLPEEFPPDRWLNCPAGVRIFMWLGDVLCAKVGASIAGTVFGVSIYLFIEGFHEYVLTLSSFALCYAFFIFPRFFRGVMVRQYVRRERRGTDLCTER